MSIPNLKECDSGIYDARVLGRPKMFFLGLQHFFVMFGSTVLIPILTEAFFGEGTGISVQLALFFSGIGTILFHIMSKLKVPAYLGSSFSYLGGFQSVASLNTGKFASMSNAEKLPYACGGIVVAGLLYIILALVIKLVGAKKVMRFLPPVVTGPIIMIIGINIASSAASRCASNPLLAVITVAAIIIVNIWGRGTLKLIPVIAGMAISYIAAVILHFCGILNPDGTAILNFSSIAESSTFGFPPFILAKFDISAVLIMAPIAIASMVEHIGDISSVGATTGKDYISNPGLHRTLIGDGLSTSIAAMFGGPANTTFSQNTGTLSISRVYDPRVVRIAAYCAVLLSFSPVLAEAVRSVPSAVVGGACFILCGMIASVGIRSITDNHVDFSKPRNLIISALIFAIGFGVKNGVTFTIWGTSITLTGLALAAIIGITLNAILPRED